MKLAQVKLEQRILTASPGCLARLCYLSGDGRSWEVVAPRPLVHLLRQGSTRRSCRKESKRHHYMPVQRPSCGESNRGVVGVHSRRFVLANIGILCSNEHHGSPTCCRCGDTHFPIVASVWQAEGSAADCQVSCDFGGPLQCCAGYLYGWQQRGASSKLYTDHYDEWFGKHNGRQRTNSNAARSGNQYC